MMKRGMFFCSILSYKNMKMLSSVAWHLFRERAFCTLMPRKATLPWQQVTNTWTSWTSCLAANHWFILVPMLFSCHPRTWRVRFQTAALLFSGWLYSMADGLCLQDTLAGTYFWSGYVTTFQTLNTQTLPRSDHVLLGKSWCRHVTFSSFRKHKLKTHKATKKTHFWARHDCWVTAGRSRRKKNQRVGSSGSGPSGRSPSTASEVRCCFLWDTD